MILSDARKPSPIRDAALETKMRTIEPAGTGINSPMDMDPVEGNRLVPETDSDKALLRHIISNAIERMGQWHSFGGTHKMRFAIANVGGDLQTVAEDGTLRGYLIAERTDADNFLSAMASARQEPAVFWAEYIPYHHPDEIEVMWKCGNDSNYVQPGCWVVRNYE